MKKNIPVATLLLSISFCVLLLSIRVIKSGQLTFLFLSWNLFLAMVPYGISTMIKTTSFLQKNTVLFWSVLGTWLAFFPNAPYIITDLQHLRITDKQYLWFDVILISFFAINGLWLALLSLRDIEIVLTERYTQIKSRVTILFICFLCGFGIYLGRFLRWNSWDILQNPLLLLDDILARIIHPLHYSKTWSFTLIFGTFMVITYALFNTDRTTKTSIHYKNS